MKKRLIGSLIAVIMIFSLVGCGGNEKSKEEGNSTPVASEESSEDKEDSKDDVQKELESRQRKVTKEEIVQIADKHYDKMRKLLKEDGFSKGEVDKYKDGIVKLDYVGDRCEDMTKDKNKVGHVDIAFSESNNAGTFGVTVSYNIDMKDVKNGKDVDLRKTPFEKYGSILDNDLKLDYDELNKKVNEAYRNADDNFEYETVFYEESGDNVMQMTIAKDEILFDVVSPQYIYK